MAYWLLKSEPDAFSIDDLHQQGEATWDGVRNHQAKNYIARMQPGDLFLFYHSSCTPPGLAGCGEIISTAYPDLSALDPHSPGHDPRSSKSKLPWLCVDVRWREKFPRFVSLQTLKASSALQHLPLLKRGNRLSVMPVNSEDFTCMVELAGGKTHAC
ncbi:EVE domain-containing protein [Halopseudomonas salegens]|uniref:Predicted RNA-binding protein, contains PUA-like domain n=1 Tax=Halopseudomonas salegens TaxID=1434072 RepID=A0A1H2H2D8_9GAMM|nr:EVE domain-containing protein [Halopseudomonas salegens]SDU25991.1 Predicted RNA-binding protein, contains PUA-like domain [Halopseudomonas salegens]